MRTVAVLTAVLILTTTGCGTGHDSARPSTAKDLTRGSAFNPAWSRDGKRIVWAQTSGVGTNPRIWIAMPDGSDEHPISEPIDALGRIAWLPGRKLVYWANSRLFRLTPGGRSSLVASVGDGLAVDAGGTRAATGSPGCPSCASPILITELGTGTTRRIGGRMEMDMTPSLSPDGRRVAFSRYRCHGPGGDCDRAAGIWVAPTTGGRAVQIMRSGVCVSWSPDARTLAYVGIGSSLRVVPSIGGKSTVLIRDVECNTSLLPDWSPNSRSLAVVRGHEARLVIVNAETHRSKVVTGQAVGAVNGFAWSPDSSAMLVTGRPGPKSCSSLWKVNAVSGASHLLRKC